MTHEDALGIMGNLKAIGYTLLYIAVVLTCIALRVDRSLWPWEKGGKDE